MTDFEKKSFSVYPGANGGQAYRDNWDAIFAHVAPQCPKCGNTDCGWFATNGRCLEKLRITEELSRGSNEDP